MADHSNDIGRYLRGEMTPAEMHALEKKALSDPFLSDAMEGAAFGADHFSEDVKELNEKVSGRRNRTTWFSPLRIAASVIVIAVSAYLIYWSSVSPEQTQTLAEVQKKPLSPALTSKEKDSLPLDEVQINEQKKNLMAINKQPAVTTAARSKNDAAGNGQPTAADNILANTPAETETTVAAAAPPATPAQRPEDAAKPEPAAESRASGPALRKITADTAGTVAVQEEVVDVRKPDDEAKSEVSAVRKAGTRSRKMLQRKAEKIPAPSMDDTMDRVSTIRGHVTTMDERRPLGGISVKAKGGSSSTRTDAQGNYTISSSAPVTTLVFSSEGVETSEVDAVGGSNVDVQLSAPGKAGEIVVSGGEKSSDYDHNDSNIQFASPLPGSRSYNKYLLSSLIYPAEALEKKTTGIVQVEFTVRRDSTVSDFKIERSIGSGCEEELIRLVRTGPRWVPLKQGGNFFDSRVRVRMKFTLPK